MCRTRCSFPASADGPKTARVRGAAHLPYVLHAVLGTIPAGAGSRTRRSARRVGGGWSAFNALADIGDLTGDGRAELIARDKSSRRRDHPRGCGEQTYRSEFGTWALGPSSRVRGAVHEAGDPRLPRGTIPAGCEEQESDCGSIRAYMGPSLRVRGAVEGAAHAAKPGGTIPADAGSSPSARPCRPSSRDHPRGCGEQALAQT